MAAQGQQFLARGRVPHPGRIVLTPRRQTACRPGSRPRSNRTLWPRRVSNSLPLGRIPHLRRLVRLAVASRLPSGLQATLKRIRYGRARSAIPCPLRRPTPSPSGQHSRVASRLPSGLQATLHNVIAWPAGSAIPCRCRRPTPSPSYPRSPSPAACRPGSRPRSITEPCGPRRVEQFLAAAGVPHFRRLVLTPRRQPLAVRAPGHAVHRFTVAAAGSAVPYPSRRPTLSPSCPRSRSPAACRPGSRPRC